MAPIKGKADMDHRVRDHITVVVREASPLFSGEIAKGVESLVIPKRDAHLKAKASKGNAKAADIGDTP